MKFDDVLERHVGSFGRYQIVIVVFACYIGIPACLLTLDVIFTAATPKYRCEGAVLPYRDNYTNGLWTNISGGGNKTGGDEEWNTCSGYFLVNITGNGTGNWSLEERSCNGKYEYDTSIFKTTIITEWDLICEKSFLVSITKSIAMAGIMVGAGLGGFLADKFGRRPIILIGVVFAIIARFAMTFSVGLAFYNTFNFVAILSESITYIVVFTLVMELVGPKWRAITGSLMSEIFAIGYCLLALLAYLIRDWKTLNLAILATLSPCLCLICLLPESPRWLLVKGDDEKAYQTLELIARRNGRSLPPNIFIQKQVTNDNEKTKVWSIFTSRLLLCRYLIVFFAWFVAAFTYYGITLNVENLVGDIYLNVAVTGILEFIAYFLSQLMVSAPTGRRITTFILYLLAGISLLLTLAVPSNMPIAVTVLVQFGRFCVSAFYNCIYIWSGELFPTVVRNSGMSTVSCVGKIGAIIAPYAAELGRIHPSLPIISFGSLALLCGVLLLVLPETKGRPLPQNINDVKDMFRGRRQVEQFEPSTTEELENMKQ